MKHLFGKNNGEEHNFWMSYTDLMSGFLIVFIVAALVFYNQRNSYLEKIPEDQIDSLSVILKQYSVKQLEDAANALYRYKIEEIDSISKLIDQYSYIELAKAAQNLKSRGNMAVINEEFTNVFNVVKGVKPLPEKGVIRFYPYKATEMFVTNEDILQSNLKERLKIIGKAFVEKAMEIKENGNDIEIRIEGHADSRPCAGRYEDPFVNNLLLSSKRAIAVYNCLMEECGLTDEEKQFVKKYVVAVGYSSARPVTIDDIEEGEEDMDKSRRIEFRIISK